MIFILCICMKSIPQMHSMVGSLNHIVFRCPVLQTERRKLLYGLNNKHKYRPTYYIITILKNIKLRTTFVLFSNFITNFKFIVKFSRITEAYWLNRYLCTATLSVQYYFLSSKLYTYGEALL